MVRRAVSIVTGWGGNLGTGHVERMTALAAFLRRKHIRCVISSTPPSFVNPNAHALFSDRILPDTGLIIRDMRDSTREEIASLRRIAPVIVIDDCGEGRAVADAAVDILPNPTNPHPPRVVRLYGFSFCDFIQSASHLTVRKTIDVAIYLGRDLDRVLSIAHAVVPPSCRSAILDGTRAVSLYGECDEEQNHPALALCRAKVLLTHFGITLYEGLCAGCRVVAFNPTAYHSQLSEIAREETGIVNAGVIGLVDQAHVRRIIADTVADVGEEFVSLSRVAAAIEEGMNYWYRLIGQYLPPR